MQVLIFLQMLLGLTKSERETWGGLSKGLGGVGAASTLRQGNENRPAMHRLSFFVDDKQAADVRKLVSRVMNELETMPQNGRAFKNTVQYFLRRERHWVSGPPHMDSVHIADNDGQIQWKLSNCPPLGQDETPLQPAERATAAQKQQQGGEKVLAPYRASFGQFNLGRIFADGIESMASMAARESTSFFDDDDETFDFADEDTNNAYRDWSICKKKLKMAQASGAGAAGVRTPAALAMHTDNCTAREQDGHAHMGRLPCRLPSTFCVHGGRGF